MIVIYSIDLEKPMAVASSVDSAVSLARVITLSEVHEVDPDAGITGESFEKIGARKYRIIVTREREDEEYTPAFQMDFEFFDFTPDQL